MKYKKGYAKSPYFLSIQRTSGLPALRDYFKYREEQENHNKAVDTLIDFFPDRSSLLVENMEQAR